MTDEVVGIEKAALADCAAVLARAFEEDPLQRYVLPEAGARPRVAPRQFGPVVDVVREAARVSRVRVALRTHQGRESWR